MADTIEECRIFPPVRKVPRKYKCYRGYHPSFAMNDDLRYESRSVERKLFWFLDFMFVLSLVKSIYPQPFRIEYFPGHYYYPDVLVIFQFQRQKPWLLEAKGGYFNADMFHKEKQKFRAAVGFARKHGFIFHFVTPAQLSCVDDDILEFLATHRGKYVPRRVQDAILQVLRRYGPMSPNEIPTYCKHDLLVNVAVEQIWQLVADGKLFCDLKNNQFNNVIASPFPLHIYPIRRSILFKLPFILVRGEHD